VSWIIARPWAVGLCAGLLVAALLMGGFALWLGSHDDALIARRDGEWRAHLTAQRAAEQDRQMAAAKEDYERGLEKGAALAKAAQDDRVASTTTIERVIHESPSAEACRYDAAAALASNSLRQRPD
jgi:ABC-type transport system involved in cytochrome bd biosynthesis fused ATPase/permease subunit